MRYCLLLLFCGSCLSAFSQMYYYQGRQVYGGDSLLNGNARGMSINPAHLGEVRQQQTTFDVLQLGGSFYAPDLQLGELADFAFTDK